MLGLLYHVTKGLPAEASMKYQVNAVVTGEERYYSETF
jgi:hypothetical protein